MADTLPSPPPALLRNGPGAAAILSAAIGSCAFGVFAFAADAVPAINHALAIWKPSGALSGVSTAGIAVWLAVWFVLSRRWASRDISLLWVNLASALMLIAGLLLTFPPVMDWLQAL
nr:hypothetical protein [uncultured Rhodopila sp.]